MQFWKMNGAGNDFIILNNIQEGLPAEAFPVLARTLCTPHRSLGADGFMVVEPAQGEGDFRMRFYNSDGSVGRCAATAPGASAATATRPAWPAPPSGWRHRRPGHRGADLPAGLSGPPQRPHHPLPP